MTSFISTAFDMKIRASKQVRVGGKHVAKREPKFEKTRNKHQPRRRKKKKKKGWKGACCQTDVCWAGGNPERNRIFSSVKSLLLSLRQITYKPALPLSCSVCTPTHSHLSASSCPPHADRQPAEKLNLPLLITLPFSLSEKQPSPHNSQEKKIQVGDTITVNRFFLHSALPEASFELFTVYKVLILPLLTVAYEDSVYQRLAADCFRHEMRFSFSPFLALGKDRDESAQLDNLSKWKRRICHFHYAINPCTFDGRVKNYSVVNPAE